MKKQFIPEYDDKQFINSTHKVNLTGGELSTILYILEGYINPTNDNSYDPDCRKDIDRIFVVVIFSFKKKYPIRIEKSILVSLNAPTIGIGALVKAHTTIT